MKFNPEEISLCKQVAEKHRKVIEYGDWFIDTEIGGKPFLSLALQVFSVNLIPLWTISDCLEFLRKKGCKNYLYLLHHETPLIACLKAVLAVLEEK